MMMNEEIVSWEKYHYPPNFNYYKGDIVYDEKDIVSGTPFVLCGKTIETSGGSTFYMIRYRCDGEQKELLAKTNDLQLKSKCAPLLVSHAFKVNDGRKFNRVMEYITACQRDYGEALKTIYATENNGWNEDYSMFAIGKEGIMKDKVVPIYTTITNPKHVDVFEKKGSEEIWVNSVSGLLGYDLVRFRFYDAMTAPLLKILGLESHTFEHTGKTSSGKSTISKVIASSIGNPTDILFPATSTRNAIVKHVTEMTDIPTFLEEATSKKEKETVKNAIYDIANGMEKMRAQIDGSLRTDIKTFKAVTQITCEGSIREDMEHAGEMYRVNSLEEMLPYIEGIAKLNKEIEENYGHFFIRYIQKIINEKDSIRGIYYDFLNSIENDVEGENKNIVDRSRDLYAGIMTAGYLCEQVFKDIGIKTKNYKKITLDFFEKCVKKNYVELDHIRALRMINDWVIQNDMCFLPHNDYVPDLKFKPLGVIIKDKGEIRIVGTQFTKILKDWGFNSPGNIAKCLTDEGVIRTVGDVKGKAKFPVNGKTTTGVVIKIAEMEDKLGMLKGEILD